MLGHLDEVRPTSPAGLARHLGIRPSTLSAALAHLEALGYVARTRDAADRRRHQLRLTARGARAAGLGSILDAERVRGVLARLDARERRHALAGLATLARAARESMDEYERSRT